ncbi:peptide chain release factor 2 [Methylicorpusculum sp.]|uniref:peptide chain release factor 2 n=1 Tax=Methylicorpusculum sp. TaxID=2713644 RepID=UPI002ABB4CA5|nr:peptide chain release factor 2 [Methylicorpusculum sp.]MDZ4151253.1 peptide chain release factor 2 [Methylicorpusculum sp.]
MLIDELQESLKSLQPDIDTIKAYWHNAGLEELFAKLSTQSSQEEFWKDPNQTDILKQLQRVRAQRDQYQLINTNQAELQENLELFKDDDQELKKLEKEVYALRKAVTEFKVSLLMNEPQDASSCFFSINSGAGGTESQDWASMLLRMYVRFCEREKLSVEIIDYQDGEEAGIKSATLFIRGKNPYGLLKGEQGIHRLVRISPYDSNKRRHTSFAAATAVPEIPDIEVVIEPKDLRIDTYRSGGAGGQHVNKTDSAIRITHLPTNTVTQCQSERSQTQNKETAMKMLKAKLAQKMKDEQDAKNAAIEKKKIEWGSQIRSYVLHPYKMVKDHRTEQESPQPDLVLDGDIMEFIESYLVWKSKAA